MLQGVDRTFLHYGIRQQDLNIITELCDKHGLDSDWVKEEILKSFHEKRIEEVDLDDKDVVKVISKALQKIR